MKEIDLLREKIRLLEAIEKGTVQQKTAPGKKRTYKKVGTKKKYASHRKQEKKEHPFLFVAGMAFILYVVYRILITKG